MVVDDELARRVEQWMVIDPDPDTRAELATLLATGASERLGELFATPLTFGTAGIRGQLGPGPARVNRVVVQKIVSGIAEWICDLGGEAAAAGVVVGRDARHGSAAFFDDTVRVLSEGGVKALAIEGACPTPFVPFSVRRLAAAAGIMITASHNPPRDNGLKVYLADGAQVFPPYDAEISEAISRGRRRQRRGRAPVVSLQVDDVANAYRAAIISTAAPRESKELKLVYTPLHGVGGLTMPKLLKEAGFEDVNLVFEQEAPDPDFPTTPSPNPEEAQTFDLAIRDAVKIGADLIIANDPDADRLAVAVPDAGGWRRLTGDEIGVLLADWMLRLRPQGRSLVATSVVSSSMLAVMARDAGVEFVETLTGFKWISRAGRPSPLLFGYEEAYGYAVNPVVADKDGLSAGIEFCNLVASLRANGSSVPERLDELALKHGVFLTEQVSFRIEGYTGAAELMSRLRRNLPTDFAGIEVTDVIDLLDGVRNLPPSDVLLFELCEQGSVKLRPSGTEPKVKAYIEVCATVRGREELRAARAAGSRMVERLKQGVVHTCRRLLEQTD